MNKRILTIISCAALVSALFPRVAIVVGITTLFAMQLQKSFEEVEGEAHE